MMRKIVNRILRKSRYGTKRLQKRRRRGMTAATKLNALRNRLKMSQPAFAHALGYKGVSGIQRHIGPNTDAPYVGITLIKRMLEKIVGRGSPPIRAEEIWDIADPTLRPERIAERPNIDPAILSTATQAADDAIKIAGVPVSSNQRAILIGELYDESFRTGAIDPRRLSRLVAMLRQS